MHSENTLIDRIGELVSVLRLNRFGDDALWTLSDVAEYLRYSEDHARRAIHKSATFPKPVRISEGGRRWIAREVKEWGEQTRSLATHKVGRPRKFV